MTTLGTMKSRMADELHRTDLTTYIDRGIRTAIGHWESTRLYFNEGFVTLATTAGQQTYSAGNGSLTDVLRVNSVRLTINQSRYPLTEWTYRQLAEENVSTALQSAPDHYVWYSSSLLFYPVPNATYTALCSTVFHITMSASNSASNAWTTEAETLIRQRGLAIVRTDFLRDPRALAEAAAFAAAGEPYLSALEKQAFQMLRDRSDQATTGRIVPTKF